MKSLAFFKHAFISGSITALLVTVAFGQDTDLKNRFESAYNAWKTIVDEHPYSDLAMYNPHIYEIGNMGAPVLPLLVEKMENTESGHRLNYAFYLITKKRFEKEDWPKGPDGKAWVGSETKKAMFLDWYRNGIKNTSIYFNRYYREWKRYLDENNTEEAEKSLKRIIYLGTPAIPLMIEKINEGDLEFIKIISDHTRGSLSENASKDECINWWNSNKEKWTIKFDDSEPIDDKE